MITVLPTDMTCPTCNTEARELSYDSKPPLLKRDGGDLVKVTTGWSYEPCGHLIGDGAFVLARQPYPFTAAGGAPAVG